MTPPLHADEVTLAEVDVRRLLAAQAPALATLPLRPFPRGGTDNALWRIGNRAIGRFPRVARAEAGVLREISWLPRLPVLPLHVPVLRVAGQGDAGYPFAWAVLDHLPGQDAQDAPPDDAAAALSALVLALQRAVVPKDLPPTGPGRLAPESLAFARDMAARFLPVEGNPAHLLDCLAQAAELPDYAGQPVWTHGDLHPLNLLTRRGRLQAVIDWGSLGAGDPARDLVGAWTMLDQKGRARFRAALDHDPAVWDRARAFVLVMAVQAIPYYRETNPRFRAAMLRALTQVLADL